ncbi:MAG TPA: hypothetical protein VGX50_11575 [Longimicrobium sp.]|nr:hypothetical protein [Longimicrobium sp.]
MNDHIAMPPYLRTMLYGLLGFTTLAVAFMIARPAPPVASAVERDAAVTPLRQEARQVAIYF